MIPKILNHNNHGFLALVASPIGNLEDITFRAIHILKQADLIAAEDTRRAKKLLGHYDILCPLMSYNKDNEHRKTSSLLKKVISGKNVAILVDSGTPCISDPGYLLVREGILQGIRPLVIPGVSALTYSIVASGLPVSTFSFSGFLPKRKGKRRVVLKELAQHNTTFFLFESPYRLNQLFLEIIEEIGPETFIVVIREATKTFEELIRGSAKVLLEKYGERKWKGECTVAITTHFQTSFESTLHG